MVVSKKCVVKGRVQGVFFRATAASTAEELGIAGSAINLPNGDVQVIAVGEESSINTFIQWLNVGPRQAVISSVSCEPYTGEPPNGFTIG